MFLRTKKKMHKTTFYCQTYFFNYFILENIKLFLITIVKQTLTL